jgi:hypothetical protein
LRIFVMFFCVTGIGGEQSEEQARAGAEAGSRLLEYITGARGGVNGGVAGSGAVEPERRSKLPLFMRNNGAHGAAHQSLSQSLSPLSHDGQHPSVPTPSSPYLSSLSKVFAHVNALTHSD